jgi:hypothetical protein
MARPRKTAATCRSRIVHVRLADDELAYLKRHAKALRVRLSTLLRTVLTNPRNKLPMPPYVPRTRKRRRKLPWPRPKAVKLHNDITTRMTKREVAALQAQAKAAGIPQDRYAHELALGRRPKAKPAKTIIHQKLVYELQSIHTNFCQLADATKDKRYATWAEYVETMLVTHILRRPDLAELAAAEIPNVNLAGQVLNSLARRANSGFDLDPVARKETLQAVKTTLAPIHQLIEDNPAPKRTPTKRARKPGT